MNASALLVVADVEWNGHMDWDGGWWIVMALGMVIFWALVIAGIVWLVRESTGRRGPAGEHHAGDPLALLDRRLADGSITPDEYRERRAILVGKPLAKNTRSDSV